MTMSEVFLNATECLEVLTTSSALIVYKATLVLEKNLLYSTNTEMVSSFYGFQTDQNRVSGRCPAMTHQNLLQTVEIILMLHGTRIPIVLFQVIMHRCPPPSRL